jgi:cysteine desulfurase
MFWKRRIYFDTAAGVSANPSSPHREGRQAKKMLEEARMQIARLIEVQSDDVVFTSGATEANALAILGLLKVGDHALYLPSAHASIVENMKLAATRSVQLDALPIKDYQVDIGALKKMLRPTTKLVAMDAVCGETGVVWNTREVKQAIGTKILLHVDASQAPTTEKITRAHFGADMLTFDASKVGAIRGIGVLVAHRTIPLIPLYEGGGQERGLRSGSEAPELAQGFAGMLRAAANEREAFRSRAEEDRKFLVGRIIKAIPNVYINEGPTGNGQASHILNLSLLGRDTDYLVALLDEAGIAVSTRSACETDSEIGSRAVFALTSDEERAKATLRISWGPSASKRDFVRFVAAITEAVAFVDKGTHR